MTVKFIKTKTLAVAVATFAAAAIAVSSCKKDSKDTGAEEQVVLKDYSVTPVLLKKLSGFENLELFSLFSSEDKFPESEGYTFGGSADGAGLVKNPAGGYVMMVNNEDNYSVSRISFNNNLKPVKGEYAINSDGGQWRLCSGTMVTKEENGFGPFYLSVGESAVEAQTHKLNPLVSGKQSGTATAGLGHWSGENAVPLNKDAYTGKTVIVMGEDADDASGGQVVLYVANTVGDLDNGTQYMLKRTDGNQKETDMKVGSSYDVEFVKIENHKTITGAQIQAMVDPLKAIKFGRVEDVDYRKGSAANSREVYFNVTGQAATGFNADNSRTVFGRTYKLVLNASDPTKGKLECILDGDDKSGPAKEFQNPDNICVTTNYVYIQEDSNTYGGETHDAYIYQYNIATKEVKKVVEIDHRRSDPKFKATAAKGNWEYGALVDISDVIGIPNTFTLCIQPHTWREDAFKGKDGGSKRPDENQGSQVVIIKGLAR
ncbi:hypothetical protein [Pedobacter ginsengisoli]|uniref:hypothetical protein n=1 Tax=Pedobacter ginsengisoli TaxID=363852 RepID=UPI001FE4A5E7|nr:hypothetical protein [Pedobacter ginsengisoli]